jgi:hypothetical protein
MTLARNRELSFRKFPHADICGNLRIRVSQLMAASAEFTVYGVPPQGSAGLAPSRLAFRLPGVCDLPLNGGRGRVLGHALRVVAV